MEISVPLRHELKYYISAVEYEVLRRVLAHTLNRDPNGDENNEYHIRSLYFDTIYNDAILDKINGVRTRDKYRIRIYNFSDRRIRMECKTKLGSLISKRSLEIPKLLAEQLIARDPTGLEQTHSGLLRDIYREMKLNLLRPVVLVDYIREAYTHPAEEVRITFDKQLRTGLRSTDLFNPYVPTVSPFSNEETILEVKYNRVLPPYIRDLLCTYVRQACNSAISKYVWCRTYERFE
ncbi:MAG: polyphosphate polymerase domain-containing protein [Clostridia bacterium]|nr:polyphosphate polymerase domain-containing protein [Clostridia bacterium]